MSIPTNVSLKKYYFFGILFFLYTTLTSQESLIQPFLTSTTIEKLTNGLHYVIEKNPNNTSTILQLVVNVGAIHENDDEIGYAHFLEHLAFGNGKRFPKHSFIDFLTQKGLELGKHYNAITNHDNTIFTIKLSKEANLIDITTTLHFFADVIDGLALNDDEIEKQKSIILQELYSRQKETNDDFLFLVEPSKYAQRNIIGSEQNIKNCSSESIRNFYTKNYAPENAAIFISSSDPNLFIDKRGMENIFNFKSKNNSSKEFEVNLYKNLLFKIKNTVIPQQEKELIFNWPTQLYKHNNSHNLSQKFISKILGKILEDRLNSIAKKHSFSFYRNYFLSNVIHNTLEVKFSSKTKKMLNLIFKEIAILSSYGISDAEFKHYKSWLQESLNSKYLHLKNSTNSLQFYTSLFKTKQQLITIDNEEKLSFTILENLNKNTLKEAAKKLFTSSKSTIELKASSTQTKLTKNLVKKIKENILSTSLKNKEILPKEHIQKEQVQKSHSTLQLQLPKLKNQTPTRFSSDSTLGITHLGYANGINIYLKQVTSAESIYISGKALGGLSAISDSNYHKYESTSSYLDLVGVSNLNYNQTQDYLSEKNFGVSATISEFERNIFGYTNNNELEEFFKFLYAKMMLINNDDKEFKTVLKEEIKNFTPNKNVSTLWDSHTAKVAELTNSYFPNRTSPKTIEEFQDINLKDLTSFYNQCFQNGNGWSFYIIGNFQIEQIQKLISLYLGNLKSEKSLSNYHNFDYKKFKAQYKFNSKPLKKLINNTIIYYGKYELNSKNNFYLDVIEKLLQFSVNKELREKHKLVYTPSVTIEKNKRSSDSFFTIQINYNCLKKDVKKAKHISLEIIKNFTKEIIPLNDLNFSKKAIINSHKEVHDSNNVYLWNSYLASQINTEKDCKNLKDIIKNIASVSINEISNFLKNKIDFNSIKIVQTN